MPASAHGLRLLPHRQEFQRQGRGRDSKRRAEAPDCGGRPRSRKAFEAQQVHRDIQPRDAGTQGPGSQGRQGSTQEGKGFLRLGSQAQGHRVSGALREHPPEEPSPVHRRPYQGAAEGSLCQQERVAHAGAHHEGSGSLRQQWKRAYGMVLETTGSPFRRDYLARGLPHLGRKDRGHQQQDQDAAQAGLWLS